MLWFEGLFRPFERGVEFHSDEVPDFPINAITHIALELQWGLIPVNLHTQGNGLFHL